MKNIEIAKKLFSWNFKNLIANAQMNKADLKDFFASLFQVYANGRNYAANYDNYFEFLNQLIMFSITLLPMRTLWWFL